MKKIAMLMAGLVLGATAFAQTTSEPNRLFVNDNGGGKKGFVMERLTDLSFARVDGDVLAQVQINDVTATSLKVSITRTPECKTFLLDVLPRTLAGMLSNDANMIDYVTTQRKPGQFDQDFSSGELTGIELTAGGEYTLVTIGKDMYGCEVGVCRENFTVPAVPVVGNPRVEAQMTENTLTSFTVKFTPNSDVMCYYTVAGEKGTMEAQYEQFGPMFGFTNMGDLIKTWGSERYGEETYTWSGEAPNTDYEVYILALDKNGNPAPYQIYEVSTLPLGGEGEANVEITIGDYKLADWDGQMKPSQFITFAPNDQASCFRYRVYMQSQYDASAEEIKADLCSDPPMPTAYWFFYDTITTDFQIDPGVPAIAIGAAKNINGEWGPVNEVRFTTPATAPSAAPASKVIVPRQPKRNINFVPGKVPELGVKKGGIQLR